MVKIIPTATAVSPFNWPMFTDPSFSASTSDFYEDAVADPSTYYNYIPSLYISSSVNFKIDFVGTSDAEGDTVDIKSVELISFPSAESQLTRTIVSKTVFIQGIVASLPGEQYKFLMRNGSLKILPPNTSEDWLSVVQWSQPPRPWERLNTYTFNITYDLNSFYSPLTNQQITVPVYQYAYWHWSPALSAFSNLVQQGS
jgi:hypothetical protein